MYPLPNTAGLVMCSIIECWLLQIAAEVKKYKSRNPGWHGPKSVKKRVG